MPSVACFYRKEVLQKMDRCFRIFFYLYNLKRITQMKFSICVTICACILSFIGIKVISYSIFDRILKNGVIMHSSGKKCSTILFQQF